MSPILILEDGKLIHLDDRRAHLSGANLRPFEFVKEPTVATCSAESLMLVAQVLMSSA